MDDLVIHDLDCDLDEDCLCAVRPSWWGRLPLPPVRPRYIMRSFTGFTAGGRGGGWTWRKERTTWHVYDKLNQGLQVGPPYNSERSAWYAKAKLEREWDDFLVEQGYDLAA